VGRGDGLRRLDFYPRLSIVAPGQGSPGRTAGSYGALFAPTVPQVVAEIQRAFADASAVVVDLRSSIPTDAYARFQLTYAFGEIERLFAVEPLHAPGEWYRVHAGLETGGPFSSGQYTTGVFVRGGQRIGPSSRSRGIPIVFVLNEHSGVLPTMFPLRAAGRARIVFEGDPGRHTIGEAVEIELTDGVRAMVRRSESVLADGTSATFVPDEVVSQPASRDGVPALDRAIDAARAFEPSSVARGRLPAVMTRRPDRSYPQMWYPDVEYRVLAAFRIWNTILHFYPYRDLLDHDWDGILGEHLPSFIAARNAGEYARAVAAMVERVQDSHAYLAGTLVTEELMATGFPPIRVRMIEDTPVVTRIDARAPDGIAVGDSAGVLYGLDTCCSGRSFFVLEVRAELLEGDLGPNGKERVEFVIQPNPGEPELPVRRYASGGELSRIMLAIRLAQERIEPGATYVFDEVDAGIGGETATAVGAAGTPPVATTPSPRPKARALRALGSCCRPALEKPSSVSRRGGVWASPSSCSARTPRSRPNGWPNGVPSHRQRSPPEPAATCPRRSPR
jgi:hypothetical protein